MKYNLLQDKVYKFAIKAVKLHIHLYKNRKEVIEISRQFLRSSTSIGANLEEAIGAVSRKEFLQKLGICYKEARETLYWVNLMKDTDIIKKEIAEVLNRDIVEIVKIITKIQKTTKVSSNL